MVRLAVQHRLQVLGHAAGLRGWRGNAARRGGLPPFRWRSAQLLAILFGALAEVASAAMGRGMAMDGEGPVGTGYLPLVPPPRSEGPEDLLELQRRGIEMIMAANRLAVGWLQAAAQQHAEVTRRALEEMAETARRLAGASAPPETA